VGRDEVFEHGKPLAEVGENRLLDNIARGLGHQTAHPGKLADLLPVAPGPGTHHERHRVVFPLALVVLQRPQHDVGDLIRAVRPDVDDLVVALARSYDAAAILLLDFPDLLLGTVNLLIFFLGNDHVVNANRNPGMRRFAEAQFFQFVQHGDRLVMAANLVAPPDEVAEFVFLDGLVGEAQFRGPDFTEENPAHGGLNHLLAGIAKGGLLPVIRVRQANPLVRLDRAIVKREGDFGLGAKQL